MIRRVSAIAAAVSAIVIMMSGCENGTAQEPPAALPVAQRAPAVTPRPAPIATLPDGSSVTLELAITQEEIARGLMFRPSLAEDRGMLFLFGHERMPAFWMKDTLISLDIIFLNASGRVVDFAVSAQPCPKEPCPQYLPKQPAAAVLEMSAGSVARHGLKVGQVLTFERVANYPLSEG